MEENSIENDMTSCAQENKKKGWIRFGFELGSQYKRYKTKDFVYEKKKGRRKFTFAFRFGLTSLLKKIFGN